MKYWLVLIFLWANSLSFAQSCPINIIGDSLLHNNKIIEANTLAEQVLFDNDQDQLECAILFKIKLLKIKGNTKELLSFISDSYAYNNLSDSVKNIIFYEEAFAHYLNKDYVQAIHYFEFYIPQTSKQKYFTDALKIICHNNLQNWKTGDSLYTALCKSLQIEDSITTKIYSQTPKLLSEKKAQTLSSFIPGAGELYAGKPTEAITAFLLQALSIYSGIIWWNKEYKLATVLLSGNFSSSFYSGGKQRAINLTHQKNLERINSYNKILNNNILQKISPLVQ